MKKALIISCGINLFLVLFFIGKRIYYSQGPPPTTQDFASRNNAEKSSIYKHLNINKGDIVFIGNSITERFPLTEMFGSMKFKNRGIGSNLTRHVLGRIGPIAQAQPESIFIEIGINDLAQKVPQDKILQNLKATIDTIRHYSPVTSIFIESVLPTTGPDKYLMPGILKLNAAFQSICKQTGSVYIDLFNQFEEGQEMNKTLTTDGTHLNYGGYVRYKNVLDKYLNSAEMAKSS